MKIYLRNTTKETLQITIGEDPYLIEPDICPPVFLEKGEYTIKLESKSYLPSVPTEVAFKINDDEVIDCSINDRREMVLSSQYFTACPKL